MDFLGKRQLRLMQTVLTGCSPAAAFLTSLLGFEEDGHFLQNHTHNSIKALKSRDLLRKKTAQAPNAYLLSYLET